MIVKVLVFAKINTKHLLTFQYSSSLHAETLNELNHVRVFKSLEELHNMKIFLFSFFTPLMFMDQATAGNNITARTEYGDIRGTVMPAPPIPVSAATKVNAFLGILFAAPPVGELRFQPPKPARAWKPSIYDATYFRRVCTQKREIFEEPFKIVIPNFGKSN